MSEPSFGRKVLSPLIPLYRAALAARELRLRSGLEPVRRLRYPVISIGNLSTGGSGKTPLTITLAKALTQRGFQVDVLSRGYGRRSSVPARVNLDGTADEFGDEPLLIARETGLPVYVARQRFEASQLAESEAGSVHGEHRPRVHLLDDGFQHRQLHRDADILLLDRHDWFDRLLPAGNLREPIRASHRASVLAIPADDPAFAVALKSWGWSGPVWRLRRKLDVPAVDGPVAAFCGIARPDQFFAGLEAAGLQLAARFAFYDHHRYTAADLKRLEVSAHQAGAAGLITTEKDRVRLGQLASDFPAWLPLETARLSIEIDHAEEALDGLVAQLPLPPAARPL
jgi:tetraacyldisaccharide 4'-kinase